MSLLAVYDLDLRIARTGRTLLRDVTVSIERGSIVGLVGESGSGKSMFSLALMGLLPNGIEVSAGTAEVAGRPVFHGASRSYDTAARDLIALVSQNPRAALNPTMRIGKQMVRVLRQRRRMGKVQARDESRELLRKVGISDPLRVERAYPHQLSGGMCQRVVIAMALSVQAPVLIADEPTTGLDVTIQAQILLLLKELMADGDRAVLMVTHDLAVVNSMCDQVIILYGGQVMEVGPTQDIFHDPVHPYTRFLLESLEDHVPSADDISDRVTEASVDFSLAGCRFAKRCPFSTDLCHREPPPVRRSGTRTVNCHHRGVS
ncbi:ABC transporter ATP-binding protein [Micromonospora sp. NPDC048830]|uniref:ABC transporter ATP-binding protein n=1 Tax=Micromonospora sp. NPDC048830 TaxID=3364257 RepID=UPI00371BBFF6